MGRVRLLEAVCSYMTGVLSLGVALGVLQATAQALLYLISIIVSTSCILHVQKECSISNELPVYVQVDGPLRQQRILAAIHAIAQRHPAAAGTPLAADAAQRRQDEHAAAADLHRAVQRVFNEPAAAAHGAPSGPSAREVGYGQAPGQQQQAAALEDLPADMDEDDEVRRAF
jgi:hypothetical protein